jgi:putative inorganic carbon (hco3(-)) transporter
MGSPGHGPAIGDRGDTVTPVTRWSSINLTLTNLVSAGLLLVVGVLLGTVLANGSARVHTLAAVLVIGVPVALVALFKPWVSIAGCFAIAPFLLYIKRFSWNTEVGLLIEASLALGLVAMLLQVSFGQRWRVWASWLTIIVLGYAFYQLLQVFNPNTPSLFHRIFGVRAILTYVVPFLAALYIVRTRRALRYSLWLWLGCAVLVGLYGLWQYFVGLNVYERWWIYANAATHVLPGGRLRIFSTLGSADAFGMYMAIGVLFCMVVVVMTPGALRRLGLILTMPVMLLGLLYSLTRGAYAGFFAALVVMALLTRSKGYAVFLVLVLVGGAVYGAANPEDYLVSRVTTTFNPTEDASYTARADALEDAWPIIAGLPFGLGPATAGRKGGELLQRADVAAESAEFVGVPLDNYYFRIGLENGWIGLLLFVALLVVVLVAGTRTTLRLKDAQLRWVGAAIIASDVAMILGAASNNYFAYLPLNIFFWFSIGVLARLPALEREAPEAPPAAEAGAEPIPTRLVLKSRMRPRAV